jgi:hypothetical protein
VSKKPRLQCHACPWKVSTNPLEIPNGYCVTKHKEAKRTIAEPGEVRIGGELRLMACHESPVGREMPCVGWLMHQLGDGNNIALRLAVFSKRISANVETVGEQHACLEDTLP